MSETNFQCGLEAVLAILDGKWKPLIVYHLASEPERTSQLRRLVTGVSEKMLIQHLKEVTKFLRISLPIIDTALRAFDNGSFALPELPEYPSLRHFLLPKRASRWDSLGRRRKGP